MSFGTSPEVSLLQARAKHYEARALVAESIDPQQHKQAEKQKEKLAAINTFQAVADD